VLRKVSGLRVGLGGAIRVWLVCWSRILRVSVRVKRRSADAVICAGWMGGRSR